MYCHASVNLDNVLYLEGRNVYVHQFLKIKNKTTTLLFLKNPSLVDMNSDTV